MKANLKKELHNIASSYNIPIEFKKLRYDIAGLADLDNNVIVINSCINNRIDALGAFFHELGHLSHPFKSADPINIDIEIQREIFTDKWAAKQLRKYDRSVPFFGGYSWMTKKQIRTFLENYYNAEKENIICQ